MEGYINVLLTIISIFVCVTVFELPKAILATRLGDSTPKRSKQLTLNPLKFIDPIGFIIMIVYGVFGVGWAKPIDTNPAYYKNGKKGVIQVAVTGMISSLIFAVLMSFLRFIITTNNLILFNSFNFTQYLVNFIYILERMSISIVVFNLIPMPPLAMAKIISVLNPRFYFKIIQHEYMIKVIIMLLLFMSLLPIALSQVQAVVMFGIDTIVTLLL